MTSDIQPIMVCDVANTLGEGVIWDHRTQRLLWTDIESSCLWQWDLSAAKPQQTNLPARLGSFALTPDPSVLIGAFEDGFARFTLDGSSTDMLAPVTQHTPHLRMNDGRTDRNGQFWAGSMAETAGSPLGSLWRLDGGGMASAHINDVRIPNSLCWNGSGDIMYFADSTRNMIWMYEFDRDSGPVGNPQVFAKTPDGVSPDGSTVDAQDCLWNAQWGGGQIVRYRPDGQIDGRLVLPVSQPTCVTFAGPNLDLLCVTSARADLNADALSAQPLAGALLVYDIGVIGRREELCLTAL
jgi:L-arabinonolactonase